MTARSGGTSTGRRQEHYKNSDSCPKRERTHKLRTLKIACPHCTQHIDLDESWFGKLLTCPTCQGIIDVPNQRTYEDITSPKPNQPRGRRASYRRAAYLALIGGLLVVTIACLIGTMSLWTREGRSNSQGGTDDSTALIPEQHADSQSEPLARRSETSPQLGPYSAPSSVDAEGTVQRRKQNFLQRLFGGGKKKEKRTPARPGDIPTQSTKHLAEHATSGTLELYLPDIVRAFHIRFGSVPTRTYRTVVEDMMREKSEPDIVKIVNEMVVPSLAALGLVRDYDADALRMHFRNQAEKPFVYAKDLSYETIARLAEHSPDFAGVRLNASPDNPAFTGEKRNLGTNPSLVRTQTGQTEVFEAPRARAHLNRNPDTSVPQQERQLCYGIPVPGKPGFVTSPHAPHAGFIDVREFSTGAEVTDPYTGRIIIVPDVFPSVPEVEVIGWETSGSESRVRLGNNTDTPLGGPFWLCGYDEQGIECFRQPLDGVDTIPAGGEIKELVSLNGDEEKRVKMWLVKLQ